MLGKLLKYELKATARIFIPIYIVLLSFSLINRLISSLSVSGPQTPQIISMFLYGSIMVAMFVITFIMMLQRFYRNLLSDEGYLMFTLPAQTWKHIISKLLVAMLWIIGSGIAAFISIIIISVDRQVLIEVSLLFSNIAAYVNAATILLTVELLLLGLIVLASGVLIIYASISLGHLFNQNRIIASIGAFLVLSTITQIIYAVITVIFSNISFDVNINSIEDIVPIIHVAIWLIFLFYGVLSTGYFLISNYILSKRLNLE